MLHKIILAFAFAGFFAAAGSASFSSPADLAKEQEILSRKLISSYARHKDISDTLEIIKDRQERLKSKINDPEIENLLNFLNICLKNIESISSKPYSHSNVQRIADLGNQINEGSRYILDTLR